MTLEQKRAKYAWDSVIKQNDKEKFKKLAKGAPALVMSNGLMPSLAFWQQKKENQPIVSVILGWLNERNITKSSDFKIAMEELQKADMPKFRMATEETLEFLKWLRNFASALS